MQVTKTNAMRMLDADHISYEVHTYDNEDGKIHGSAVANKIGKAPDSVFKTLVTHSGNSLYIFVIPVGAELDMKKAAKAAGEKKLEMLPVKDLQKWTGYIRGGCSPIGMKKRYPTFIDSSAELQETIVVSAGKVGLQLELPPEQLAATVAALFTEVIK
ncbi:Cys-tRNA(Pro)/Cys-tRNA(Cys) deacylase [Paenibacillus algorifonticola]|uniref:Cys-tRNA(Pro)/Cys-tRNA(Cys) deacylase n=1 Tax=Paenibacillus algorifonticola TaxID=684063 RepID=A0A1I2GMM5_9BACL|nr:MULTISPECIES: Cys-tRNA(Pro) deacylase [Paenibacillus]KQO15733.1 cysteinyl-tRNA(Pro) deacylase [Paenibacillus sp. Leaf72]SFF18483.1 Cys-tRNA(Pro)/Cys-tRNA(Cys) deacylase [Paenibacillus algorifonticola]